MVKDSNRLRHPSGFAERAFDLKRRTSRVDGQPGVLASAFDGVAIALVRIGHAFHIAANESVDSTDNRGGRVCSATPERLPQDGFAEYLLSSLARRSSTLRINMPGRSGAKLNSGSGSTASSLMA